MSAKWIKTVEVDDILDGRQYFVSVRPFNQDPHFQTYNFQSRGLNGKVSFSSKPGIAIRFTGCDHFRNEMRSRPTLIAIEVPADADKRWRARRRKM